MIEPLLGLFKLTGGKSEVFTVRKSSNREMLPALSPSNKQLGVYYRSESPDDTKRKSSNNRREVPFIVQKRTVKPFCK